MIPPRRPSPVPRSHRGFTLVEAIASVVILAAILAVTSHIITSAADSYATSASRAELHTELSAAMDRITSELRDARARPGSRPAAPDISALSPTAVSWTSAQGDAMTLALSGSTLTLAVGAAPPTPLAADLTGLSIRAFDESDAALPAALSGSAIDPVRRIAITLTGARQGASDSIRTRVFLRCTVAGAASD